MALSVHGITKKLDVPARESIVFPLQRGRCKKCNTTYWWGKMNGRGKFYPPFADSEARHWHVCGQTHATVVDDATEEVTEAAVLKKSETTKKSNTNYTRRSTAELIADIQALSTTLKDYGRPHV